MERSILPFQNLVCHEESRILCVAVHCLTKQVPCHWAFRLLPQILPLTFAGLNILNKYLCTILIVFQDKFLKIETLDSVQILTRVWYKYCYTHLKISQYWVLNIFKFKSLCHFEISVLNVTREFDSPPPFFLKNWPFAEKSFADFPIGAHSFLIDGAF